MGWGGPTTRPKGMFFVFMRSTSMGRASLVGGWGGAKNASCLRGGEGHVGERGGAKYDVKEGVRKVSSTKNMP